MSEHLLDLSALPAPQVVETLDYAGIRAALEGDLRELVPELDDPLAESSPLAKLLEAAAYREVTLRARVNTAARSVMLAYAGGGNLDGLAALFAVARKDGEADAALRRRVLLALQGQSTAGPAAGYRRIALGAHADIADAAAASPSPGNVTVTLLPRLSLAASTAPLAIHTLPKSESECQRVLIEAGPLPGIYRHGHSANNRGGASGARLGIEIDDDLCPEIDEITFTAATRRITVVGRQRPGGATLQDYFGARGIGSGKTVILRAAASGVELLRAADSYSGGRAEIVLTPAAGDDRLAWLGAVAEDDRLLIIIADRGAVDLTHQARYVPMLEAAETACSADDARPIGDRVTVAPAAVSTYAITATVEVAGVGPEAALVVAAARTAAQNYAAGAYALGQDIGRDAVFAALHVPGVRKATITAPAADIAVAANAAARCTAVGVRQA